MKYDNLRLCNEYIVDMERTLDELAVLVGVQKGETKALVRAVRGLADAALRREAQREGGGNGA